MITEKDYRYMLEAVELSRNCIPSATAYCVGAIVVTELGEIFKGYTHQTDPANHAEEEAIQGAISHGANLKGATIYTTMEPCTHRKSKPVSCTRLIIEHGFGRVVFALGEPPHLAQCCGAADLRDAGVTVEQIPELAGRVRRINSHILAEKQSKMGVAVEVCIDSVESALTAARCGAQRVELCDDLPRGGTTPSYGKIMAVRNAVDIGVHVLIRARPGDFFYNDAEYEIMAEDVRMCGELGCDGVVIGMLDSVGNVDTSRCRELAEIALGYDMNVTFHRAFDVCSDPYRALEDIIEIGCRRLLTSGGMPTADKGIEGIRRAVERSAGRLAVMAGAGVTPENAAAIISQTGCRDIHGTFKSTTQPNNVYNPGWADYSLEYADPAKITAVVRSLGELKLL